MAEKIGTKIDDVLNQTERFLSIVAAIPVIGTVAGLAKVLMGTGQSIVGVVGGILTSPARLTGNSKLNDRFWTHAQHGFGNIAAGTVEAIPLVGTGMFIARMGRDTRYASVLLNVETSHNDKYMPYKSLSDRDFKIIGLDDDYVKAAENIFNDRVRDNMSNKEKHKIANEAVDEAYKNLRNIR